MEQCLPITVLCKIISDALLGYLKNYKTVNIYL